MDIIRCVPPEIICAIITAAGVNDDISVSTWKKSLSFLWVCREWRIVAEPLLFSTLTCEHLYEDRVISNRVFLLQRRCFDKVKRIIVHEEGGYCHDYEEDKYELDVRIIDCLAKLLDVESTDDDLESLEIVKRHGIFMEKRRESQFHYYESSGYDESDEYDSDEVHELCADTSANIVFSIASLFPNITHLLFDFQYWTIANYRLADILISKYAKQLVKLECNLSEMDYELKDGHNIQSITLKKYNFRSQQSLQLPPHRVKNISLEFDGNFSWSLFKCGDLLPVSYDSLTRLDIGGEDDTKYDTIDDINSYSESAEKPPLAVFPKLQVLSIRNRRLSNSSLKYLLQFPVKLLRIEGRICQVYQIYEHVLDNLDQLVLKLRYFTLTEDDEDIYDDEGEDYDTFEQLSNKLFAKTCNIPEVHCTLVLMNMKMDWAGINWTNISHLYVNVHEFAGQVIEAIPKVTNLIYLEVIFCFWDIDNPLDSLIKSVTSLKRDCTEPIQSNITGVVIRGYYKKRVPELMDALEFLKWYLPKLKRLEFKHSY